MKITKRFYFEAAHRLMKHKGKCKNIHGHNYVVEVTIESEINNNDMIIDFGELKFIEKWIDENLDHSIMLNNEDDKLIKFCEKNGFKTSIWYSDPTAEEIAKAIKQFLVDKNILNHDKGNGFAKWYQDELVERHYQVSVYENQNCWATI